MHTSASSELEILLRRHLPEDTDPDITARVVNQWKTGLAVAEGVVVERVESYGPKLQASWLDREGRVVASIARPFSRQDSVREFVRDWERYMRKRGARPSVTWEDKAGPEPNGATAP